MLRYLLAAAIVLSSRAWAQDMPVTRLAGGGAAPVVSQAQAAPARPAGSQLPPLPVTQIDQRDAAASLDAQRGLSLSFLEPMPIGEVLRLLVEGTPFSLAVDPDATGTFRGELKRLTLREALTTLLTPLGLDFDVQGTIIRVMRHRDGDAPVRPEPAERAARHAAHRDQRRRDARRSPPRSPPTTCSPGSRRASPRCCRTSGRVHIDPRSGLALVSDFPERLDRVGALCRDAAVAQRAAGAAARRASSKSRCATRRRSTGAWSAKSSACRATPPTPASPPIRWRSETRWRRRARSRISGRPR